jgi:hypothetical protein
MKIAPIMAKAAVVAALAATVTVTTASTANAAPARTANVSPASCSAVSFNYADGSTPARVSMSVYNCSDGSIFVQSNSTSDSGGFYFTGNLTAQYDDPGQTSDVVACGPGICTTPRVSLSLLYATFTTDNGQFFFLNGSAGCPSNGSDTFSSFDDSGSCL